MTDITPENPKFRKYVLREFLWELEQHSMRSFFGNANDDDFKVESCEGYHNFVTTVKGTSYKIHLSWKKSEAPIIKKIT